MSVLTSANVQPSGRGHDRALRIFASSIARELKQRGYDPRHIVALASELISLACDSIRSHHTAVAGMEGMDEIPEP
jgi:hypothetical protein